MRAVEVFADIRCPFAHVGLRRFVDRRASAGVEVPLRVRAWPLELANDAPLDPALIAEEVEELRSQVAPDLFAGFDASAWPSTSLPALALASAAYGRDDATGEAVSLELRSALFERGLDIADLEVLGVIAEQHGLRTHNDAAVVQGEWNEGRERGVVGSPHFFVAGAGFFCPALHIERRNGRLHIQPDDEAFEDLLRQAFGP